jgi:hypothetical protein
MAQAAQKLVGHTTVTHKSRSKKRVARIEDAALIQVLQGAGKSIAGEARARSGAVGASLLGVFALPTNNVMELYETRDRGLVAFVFSSLDVWMSFAPEDLTALPEL